MNELPSGVRLLFTGFNEEPHPEVQRDEMDRGPINQELLNSRMRWTMPLALFLDRAETFDALITWYTDTIRVIGWFNMKHPRTGKELRVRLVDGKLGALQPIRPGWKAGTVDITVEFWQ